jgi:hypothetical protein
MKARKEGLAYFEPGFRPRLTRQEIGEFYPKMKTLGRAGEATEMRRCAEAEKLTYLCFSKMHLSTHKKMFKNEKCT